MASTSVSGHVTVVYKFHFGGSSTKARKRFVIQISDTTNGMTVGGETNKINAADMGLGLTFIDNCSNALVYTISGGASVAVIPAVPSSDGTHISLAANVSPVPGTAASSALTATAGAAGTAVTNLLDAGDVVLPTTQALQITIEGY